MDSKINKYEVQAMDILRTVVSEHGFIDFKVYTVAAAILYKI